MTHLTFPFCPAYIGITKTLHQAVFLSTLVKLNEEFDYEEFAFSDKGFIKYLHFKIGVITKCKKVLKDFGFITIRITGEPARCHYTVNMDKINKALEEAK